MSVDITVEVEAGFSRDDLFRILESIGFEFDDREPKEASVVGYFLHSEMSLYYRDDTMQEWHESEPGSMPITTDPRVQSWKIGMRLSMKYRFSYPDECESDIRSLIRGIDCASNSRFAVAYDYEVLYALKDKAGVVIF